jgi:hypothetical protein
MAMSPKKLIVVYGLLLAVAVGGWSAALIGAAPRELWRKDLFTLGPPGTVVEPVATKTVTLAGVGDMVIGDGKSNMPPNGGREFFSKVTPLFDADLMMGNLEEPITDDTGFVKCDPAVPIPCHQFRVPPSYARNLKDAGFDLINVANNHDRDYGTQGQANTLKWLKSAGLMHTGAKGEITIADVKGVKIAVLGFGFYKYQNTVLDLPAARALVVKASAQADIVAIQVHWGDEGADKAHVRPGPEYLRSEPRGDSIAFAHAVIDAGADIIFGHGPHTVRAMEVYRGRLIAYSLGNFAGGGGLKGDGSLGWGGVLHATLTGEGNLLGGRFTSTYFTSQPGQPLPDSRNRGLNLVRELTQADFPATGARISVSGAISTL